MPEEKAAPKKETEAPKAEGKFTDKDIKDGKSIAWLSYLGLLALIPYFAYKDNKFVRAHAIQGLNICIISAIVFVGFSAISWILTFALGNSLSGLGALLAIVGILGFVEWAYGIFVTVISIMGIVNAAQGTYKELPLLGKVHIIKK